jgi:hypothetical protein
LSFFGEGVHFRAQVARYVFALPRQFEIGLDVRELFCQTLVRRNGLFQALAGGENLLGSFLVLPEVGLGYLFFDDLELVPSLGSVKENSEAPLPASGVLHIRVLITPCLLSRWLLGFYVLIAFVLSESFSL